MSSPEHSPGDSPGLDAFASTSEPETVTIAQAAAAVGVSEKTIRRWLTSGRVHGWRVPTPFGEQWCLRLDDARKMAVDKGLDTYTPPPPPADAFAQLVTLTQEWTRDRTALSNELRAVDERRAQAEAKLEVTRERLADARAQAERVQTERDKLAERIDALATPAAKQRRRKLWRRGERRL